MSDNLIVSPWVDKHVFRCISRLTPKAVENEFVPGDKWFPTLLAEAKAQGIRPKTKELSVKIKLEYDPIGIEQIDGKWKLVYRILNRVYCTLHDGANTYPVTKISKADLIFMSSVPAERLTDVPQLKKVLGIWCFAKEPA